MATKTPLPRYRLQNLSQRELEEEAWQGTHRDYRTTIGGVKAVMYAAGLVPVSELPPDELRDRAVSGLRRALQKRARAQDLGLFEEDPGDPGNTVLFADAPILRKYRGVWSLEYVQPANFDNTELVKACKYAQVVAHLYPSESAAFLVAKLQEPSSYSDWKKLEKSGAVHRRPDGTLTISNTKPTSMWLKVGTRSVHLHDVREPTDQELADAGIILSDAHHYLSATAVGRPGRGLYRK